VAGIAYIVLMKPVIDGDRFRAARADRRAERFALTTFWRRPRAAGADHSHLETR
jgi:hypothetical protein